MDGSINIPDGRIEGPRLCDIGDDQRFQRILVFRMDRKEPVTGILVSYCRSNSMPVREELRNCVVSDETSSTSDQDELAGTRYVGL
jgi:hypothetical protein